MEEANIFKEYSVTILLATLNALAGWTLITVVKMKGEMKAQEVRNRQNEEMFSQQSEFNEKVMSRFHAGTKTFVKLAIEMRNLKVWKKQIDKIIDGVKKEREENKSE